MPEEAGIPIGGPKFSRYVMLEVHYNNPGLIAGTFSWVVVQVHSILDVINIFVISLIWTCHTQKEITSQTD